MNNIHTNYSFDVGLNSLGTAVNKNQEIAYAESLLFQKANNEHSKEQAERRRQYRTRCAHKAREEVLDIIWRAIGKEPLQKRRFEKISKKEYKTIKADERLEREFPPSDGENKHTVYCGVLLRIMLLQGDQLEDWQIYKALHSVIQHRGYDKNVPWKTKSTSDKNDKQEQKKAEELLNEFRQQISKVSNSPSHHLPCYFEAWRMGLWDSQQQMITSIRVTTSWTAPARNRIPREKRKKMPFYIYPRSVVEEELQLLLKAASKKIPALGDYINQHSMEAIIFGEQSSAIDTRYPSHSKITGLLGQKYPRFDNRSPHKCALIPHLNVCKASKFLAIEVGFLLQLNNIRYEKKVGSEMAVFSLTSERINTLFSKKINKANKETPEKYANALKLTKRQLEQFIDTLGGSPKAGHKEIVKSKVAGRSRFSQPALYIVKYLILSGMSPSGLYQQCEEKWQRATDKASKFGSAQLFDSPYRYTLDDLAFLRKMSDKVFIPSISLAEQYAAHDMEYDADAMIKRVISSCNWALVRHRLSVFYQQLQKLDEQFGQPDTVHFEFVREDFMSDENKRKLIKAQNRNQEANQEAKKIIEENGIPITAENINRYKLWKEQNGQCPYTFEKRCIPLSQIHSDTFQIDHIYPQSLGGPDALYNKVLVKRSINMHDKLDTLPYKDTQLAQSWESYKKHIGAMPLSKKKAKLLLVTTQPEADDLIDKYTGLAATSYIARLARDIVCLRYGWQPGKKDEKQRIFIFGGGLTSKIARKYALYECLADGSQRQEKPRDDNRHHALDAMIISYLAEWARNEDKTHFFTFPKQVTKEYFKEKLSQVHPWHLGKIKPNIAENARSYSKLKEEANSLKYALNVSKDSTNKGHYYMNKSSAKGGTRQHGYYAYYTTHRDKKKVCLAAIPAFQSLYAAKKALENRGFEIIDLLYVGKNITVPEHRATLLGREIPSLPTADRGYKIIKCNKKEVIIQCITDTDQEASRFRIVRNRANGLKASQSLFSGQYFDLDGFSLGEDTLQGRFKLNSELWCIEELNSSRQYQLGNTKKAIPNLIGHLVGQQDSPYVVKVGDVLVVDKHNRKYAGTVTKDDESSVLVTQGQYTIQGFSNEYMTIVGQNGSKFSSSIAKVLARN